MPTQLSARAFVDKWRGVELNASPVKQGRFLELCRLAGYLTSDRRNPLASLVFLEGRS